MSGIIAASSAPGPALEFAHSSSRAVAVHGGWSQKMAQYAPRIASVLKLGTFGSMTASGVGHTLAAANGAALAPALVAAAGVILLASAAIMIIYGNKERQKERAAKDAAAGIVESPPSDPISRIFYDIKKIASPARYPIESAYGLGLLSSACLAASGIMGGKMFLVGMAVFGGIASGIGLFMHEGPKHKAQTMSNNGHGLSFVQSQSTIVGVAPSKERGLLQNPIRIASIMLIINGALALANGISDGDMFFVAAGVCTLLSNTLMAVFVRKNDFNVNAAKQEQTDPKTLPAARVSHAGATERMRDVPLGHALA